MSRLPLACVAILAIACGGTSPPPSPPPESAPVATVEPAAPPTSASTASVSLPPESPPPEPAPTQPSPTQPSPTATSSTATSSSVPSKGPCVADANAKTACSKKGKGFTYGPRPYIRCSGVAPRPGEELQAHMSIRNSPCECVDEVATAQHRQQCMRVPSAAPRPQKGL